MIVNFGRNAVNTSLTPIGTTPPLANNVPARVRPEPLVMGYGKTCLWCSRDGQLCDSENTTEGDTADQLSAVVESMHMGNTSANLLEPIGQALHNSIEIDEMEVDQQPSLPTPAPMPHEWLSILDKCSRDVPKLLFRFSNNNSQGINTDHHLRAAKFTGLDDLHDIRSPSSVDKQDFLFYFKKHVRKEHKESPFISFFQSPLAPLHRALRRGANAKITIIDTTMLDTKVFAAKPLVPITGTRTPKWRGLGEYLIWGYVPKKAIVNTFQLDDLEEIARQNDDIKDFLQLDIIRRFKHCSRELYAALVNGQVQKNHEITLDRLMVHLHIRCDLQALVKALFKEQWVKLRWAKKMKTEIGHDLGPMYHVSDSCPEIEFSGQVPDQSKLMQHFEQARRARRARLSRSFSPSTIGSHSSGVSDRCKGADNDEVSASASNGRLTPSDGFADWDDSDDDDEEISQRAELSRPSPSVERLTMRNLQREMAGNMSVPTRRSKPGWDDNEETTQRAGLKRSSSSLEKRKSKLLQGMADYKSSTSSPTRPFWPSLFRRDRIHDESRSSGDLCRGRDRVRARSRSPHYDRHYRPSRRERDDDRRPRLDRDGRRNTH